MQTLTGNTFLLTSTPSISRLNTTSVYLLFAAKNWSGIYQLRVVLS